MGQTGLSSAASEVFDAGERGAIRLTAHTIEKPWGRRDLAPFGPALPAGTPCIGEIIHRHPGQGDGVSAELLVKTLFTGERLSVQVHPTGEAARRMGLKHGKDEAWLILAAEPGASIGLGLREPMGKGALRAAIADGSIVDLMDWRPCAAGDVLFAPAGTIHAIGGGITLFEVQQNLDLTYRLFDYGRARPLHLEAGMEVAQAHPWQCGTAARSIAEGRTSLIEGPSFVLERVRLDSAAALVPAEGRPVWMAVINGCGRIGGAAFDCGEVWLAEGQCAVDGAAELLLAYPGAGIAPGVWVAD